MQLAASSDEGSGGMVESKNIHQKEGGTSSRVVRLF